MIMTKNSNLGHFIEVRFASFLSGGFTTMAVINPPEKKLANAPLCSVVQLKSFFDYILPISSRATKS